MVWLLADSNELNSEDFRSKSSIFTFVLTSCQVTKENFSRETINPAN